MKHFSPNRGMIKLIKACQSPLHYDFITYSTENTITLWKMKINKRMKELSVAMVEDMQLNQIPIHIALLSNAVVIAHDKRLTFYQCKQKNLKISSFQIFQHTKDEMHSSVISDVSRNILVFFKTQSFWRFGKSICKRNTNSFIF